MSNPCFLYLLPIQLCGTRQPKHKQSFYGSILSENRHSVNTHYNDKLVVIQERKELNMYNYDKLWQTMNKKGISQYTLINEYEISESLLYRLRHNQSVSMHSINRLCDILECDIGDIVTYYRE